MKTIAAIFTIALLASPAFAGKNGSAELIRGAMQSRSQDAIIAEVERTEHLMCSQCVSLVAELTQDSRLPVREVAAWWFAKRPGLHKQFAAQFLTELASGDSIQVRNAADFLGRSSTFSALPQLAAAIQRADVNAEGKLAIVRALKHLAMPEGNTALAYAMTDADASVRAAAANAWRDIRGQTAAAPVVALLTDKDATVRMEAAATVGGLKEMGGRAALEQLVTSDASPFVRRNAAWALGQLHAPQSASALSQAMNDTSGLVRMTARVSLGLLH